MAGGLNLKEKIVFKLLGRNIINKIFEKKAKVYPVQGINNQLFILDNYIFCD